MTFFTERSNLLPYAFIWENPKTLDFLEIIELYQLKVATYCWLSKNFNKYEYQRSSSLIDLCPRSLRFILWNIFCSKASGPIEAKFQVKHLWVRETNITFKWSWSCDQDGFHAIYGNNPLKIISLSETKRLMTFELGVQHWGLRLCKVCSNEDRWEAYMPYLTLWDKISQNLAHLEASSHKIF